MITVTRLDGEGAIAEEFPAQVVEELPTGALRLSKLQGEIEVPLIGFAPGVWLMWEVTDG